MSSLDDINTCFKGGVKIGFVGCGTIASSIATGLATQGTFGVTSITVTRRSESRSSALKEAFPDRVTVRDNNQAVVDESDIVFLCVLPQHMSEVLSSLEFDSGKHTLVSLVATSKLVDLIAGSCLPSEKVYKMICLPPVAKHQGACLLFPKGNSFLKEMFESIGGCVECETEESMNAMMIPGCLMGPMYGILRNNREWLVKQGVPPEDASYFVARQYLSMVQDAERNCKDPNRFDELIAEQTPGGINEQSLKNLEGQGVFEAYDAAMDAILARLEGKSDGLVPPRK